MHRVLIIEDDDYVQNMLKQTLERAGYDVAAAANGAEGLKLYESNQQVSAPFEVVITDLIMPEMEGIETITMLRKRNPDVKVIAISGGGRNRPEDYLFLAEKLGADRTFSKPVDRQALLDAVAELVAA
ncbi:response regulator [Desulfatitalea alkaliphila]|uniref:Response regulator n=1 Tax=Desulfatitalea alkaliphila TaxID=2929485 RepID=A0AA41R5N8_9BACT|nr:response regulator [Desulfatitalea alkaliphila]MCJ8501903.1 response regulator [Desulfatitalea alkaliphila]